MPVSAHAPGLPDYVNYSRFVGPGVIELKDGAFLTAFAYAGPDQAYADYAHLEYLAAQLTHDLLPLGNGWMLEANAVRAPLALPPTVAHCPDPTSALIAAERAAHYAAAGAHYETRHVLTLTYLPPSAVRRQFSEYFFDTRRDGAQQSRLDLLQRFQAATTAWASVLRRSLWVEPLDDAGLLHFLRVCVTGDDRPVGRPPSGGRLDYVIGSTLLSPHGGTVGALHTRMVGVVGWPEAGTAPQMFAPLLTLPFALRLAQRFIPLGREAAVKVLSNKKADFVQMNAYNPKRIVFTALQHVLGINPQDRTIVAHNTDAERQADSVERAITQVQEGHVREGYYTMTVVLHDPDQAQVEAHADEVVTNLNGLGFSARIETDQAADALGGSWPGHGTRNVRKPLLTTRHFANLWPTSSPWRGESVAPCPYYPQGSGPLLVTTTTGQTPFFLNTHVNDLGNFLVIGPSGAGKSYLLNALAVAHLQYPRAQVHFFDRDAGALVPTLACGGDFFDLDAMQYAPLAHIDEENERVWAGQCCDTLASLQGFQMTPMARTDIAQAVAALATAPVAHRTMTGLLAQLQTHEAGLKEALRFYTLGHGGALLDGIATAAPASHWLTYDMEKLLGRGPEVSTPVLLTQIHETERRMDGRPVLDLYEEGWQAAANALLEKHIEDSSANLRKKGASLGLVLHSPADLAVFSHASRLLTNVATLIFLPNNKAMTEGPNGLYQHYAALGLNSRQIQRLAEGMRPKQDYLCKQGEHVREFQLASGGMERAILSANGRDHRSRIFALQKQWGGEWLPAWLKEQGRADLAHDWKQWGQRQKTAA